MLSLSHSLEQCVCVWGVWVGVWVSVCVYLTIVVHKKLFTPFNKHITGIEKVLSKPVFVAFQEPKNSPRAVYV